MKNTLLFVICIACTFAQQASAQTDSCITHLKDASINYDQGNFDQAIVLLKSTIQNCGLDKGDRIQAYKLLIQSYLSVDNLEEADKAAERIIKIDPNYAPDKFKDDAKFIALFKKFRPVPNFSIGINVGINIPFEHTINAYSVVYQNGKAPESYKTKTGFQLGLQLERRAYKDLWVQAGFSYRSSGYQHTLLNVDSSDIHYSEKLTYVDFPLSLKYYFHAHRVIPYLQAGAYFSFLSNALSTTTRSGEKDIINRTALRNTSQVGYFGGAGIGYSIKSFILFFDVRYVIYPEEVNKAGTRYNDEVNLFKYYYLDNDFTLNNMQFNIGAAFILSYKNVRVK